MKILTASIVFNEEKRIQDVIARFKNSGISDNIDFIIMDDGSTDNLKQIAQREGIRVLSHKHRRGAGAAIRTVISYAIENNYDILVIMAGNNKDRPKQIPLLINPIRNEGFDVVQGSRYLPGAECGNMPLHRRISTQFMHPVILSVFTGKKITDSTNGFRAIRLSIFKDKRINLDQGWLDHYALEPYILYKAIELGYKVKEAPVSKIYPSDKSGYTKMKPIIGWWDILRPLVFLKLGIKK
ncbi:MAG: glycosyltransferase family 2 protein [Candidatus Omnitrophica bacterium]|nr:glycosyltransferase family 2 protein [Candidatus Omnitrophota bacterium]